MEADGEKKESIDLIIKLGIDPSNSQQQVRGTLVPPGGTAKKIDLAILSNDDGIKIAEEKGIDIVLNDALIKEIQEDPGKIKFTKIIATKESIGKIKALARIFGPRKLFPNIKSNTLVSTDGLEECIDTHL